VPPPPSPAAVAVAVSCRPVCAPRPPPLRENHSALLQFRVSYTTVRFTAWPHCHLLQHPRRLQASCCTASAYRGSALRCAALHMASHAAASTPHTTLPHHFRTRTMFPRRCPHPPTRPRTPGRTYSTVGKAQQHARQPGIRKLHVCDVQLHTCTLHARHAVNGHATVVACGRGNAREEAAQACAPAPAAAIPSAHGVMAAVAHWPEEGPNGSFKC
jgi:hypothetical protein